MVETTVVELYRLGTLVHAKGKTSPPDSHICTAKVKLSHKNKKGLKCYIIKPDHDRSKRRLTAQFTRKYVGIN